MICMKNKYQRLSKEEKINAKKEYAKRHDVVYNKFDRLKKVCIFGIIYSVIILTVDILYKDVLLTGSFNINILLDCGVLIFSVFFLMYSTKKLESLINNMLVEDLRQKQIKEWQKEEKKTTKKATKKEEKEEVVEEKKETKKATKKEEKVDLSTKTVAELKEMAKAKKIEGYTSMKKAELIDALK